MNQTTIPALGALIQTLLKHEGERPWLTATLDLTPDSAGQPPILKVLGGAVRQAIEQVGADRLERGDTERLEEEGRALEEAAVDASARGALGLAYAAELDGALHVVELDAPLRSSVSAGHPRLFELVRAAYLARPVVLVTTDIHTMDVVRVQYGSASEEASVDWPAHYLTKRKQRTDRDAQGGSGAPGASAGSQSPGHSYASDERSVEEHRNLFANEAADHLAKFVRPGDLLVVEGVDEARSQLLNRLPADLAAEARQRSAPVVGEAERDRFAELRALAVAEQLEAATQETERWFSGEHGELAIAGPEAVRSHSEQGRVGTLIVHEEATGHWGDSTDARYRESAVDEDAVEAALKAALAQGATVMFSDDVRLIEEHGGMVAVARY